MSPPSKHTFDSHTGRIIGRQLLLPNRELLRRETKNSNVDNQTSSTPTHRAIIWGIVCGILGAGVIITLAVYFVLRRKKLQHDDRAEEQKTTKDSISRRAIAKITTRISTSANSQPPAQKTISSISSPIPPRPRDSTSTIMGGKTKPNRPPTLCLDQRIRVITETNTGNNYETSTGQNSTQHFRSDFYELPFISSTDNYLPIPAGLLSPQTTCENITSSFDIDNYDTVHRLQKVAPTVPPKSRRPSLKLTLEPDALSGLGDWKNSGPLPTLTLQTNLVQPPVPSDEKDRESPVLGSMSTVRINKELPLPQESGARRSNSMSDKTGTSMSSMNSILIMTPHDVSLDASI